MKKSLRGTGVYLLGFIPVALALEWSESDPVLVFLSAALSLIPLAALMGKATDELAGYLGSTWGGLMSASFGNAPEIIIGIFALRQGLVDVVKSSLVGSIVANVLFSLGLSMFFGGIRRGPQKFDRQVAGTNAALLTLAASGLIIPAAFHHTSDNSGQGISNAIAIILFSVYACSILYTLATHRQALGISAVEDKFPAMAEQIDKTSAWSRLTCIGILAIVTTGLAGMSEILTGAIEPTAESLGLTQIFSGVILLAIIGNVAETFNAIAFARKDKMDLTLGVTVGASIQVALVVAPVLVFFGYIQGQPVDLVFGRFEIIALGISIIITKQVIDDGECNWLNGIMLLGVYLMLAIAFFWLPPGSIAEG
jgi:Ca2+:H+ antiporter